MHFTELSDFIYRKQISTKFASRDFIRISNADFQSIKGYFKPSKTIFHAGGSWRSQEAFKHWHALDFGEEIELHTDLGNLNRNILLGLVHFVMDVIPYHLYCVFVLRKTNHRR